MFIPSVGIAYGIDLVIATTIYVGAVQVVRDVAFRTSQLLAQLLFTPLIALWAIWVGIAFSTRASDVRVVQQLATLASLPLLGLTSLVSFQIIKPSVPLAIEFGLGLLAIDIVAWRIVSRLFDSERLVTGHRPPRRNGVVDARS
jgi:hypothetical protein